MKKVFFCFLFLMCFCVSLQAQSAHSIFAKDSMMLQREDNHDFLSKHFEIHIAPVISFGTIRDTQDHAASHQMYGVLARAQVRVYKTVWVGVEGEQFKTVGLRNTIIPELSRKSWTGLIKWDIVPDTQPYLYLIAGMGGYYEEAQHSTRTLEYNQHGIMYVGGIGGELPLWKGLYLTGEARLTYEPHPWKTFLLRSPHIREELKVGLSIFF